ncbi:MAG: hypothetical protein JEZ03_02465 [Bacteroidales bacterium]|nr:hypothetical protein [Bacteroidales bacterium]
MNRRLLKGFMVLFVALMAASCEYEFIEPNIPPPPPPIDTTGNGDGVSFSVDIVPIWNDNDFCTSCHNTGGQKPDLTPGYAYQSLIDHDLVVAEDPDNSMIYYYLLPNAATHTRKQYDYTQADIIKRWIEEGANNN